MQAAPRGSASTARNAGYPDLREHLRTLEERGLLYRITAPVNKDTELHPLVRWQFRGGIPEHQRKAFLFEQVTDSVGRRYDHSVIVGALAASPEIYAVGLRCAVDEVPELWKRAMNTPIPAVRVERGPVHEVVLTGDALTRDGGGMDWIPVPISTPGFDNAPFITAGHWVTCSPETGDRNAGNYRGQIKGRTRIGLFPSSASKHVAFHWEEARRRGEPLPCAIVIGCTPAVSYASVQAIPYGVDEMAVAGGLIGEPIQLVRCVSVDLDVPAESELVIEGLIRTDVLEPEGPYGESHGYVHPRTLSPFLEITAITHRRGMIFSSIISQVTPSESSVIKKAGYEALFLRHLRDQLGIKSVRRVYMHEPLTNLRKFLVVQMRRPTEPEVWQALMGVSNFEDRVGKIVVAVDEDIDPENLDAVMWALCYRMKPHEDMQIITGRVKGHAPPFTKERPRPGVQTKGDDSALLINATLKEPYPPIALPKQPYMERAKALWGELGLPELKPESPWYGYSLGEWDPALDREAQLATAGDCYRVGDMLAELRQRTADGARPLTEM